MKAINVPALAEWWRQNNMGDERKLAALLQHLAETPIVEKLGVRPCAHVEAEELTAWALVRIHNLPGCDHRGEQLALSWAACALCAGRALGGMFAADTERGLTREAFDAMASRVSAALEQADLKPSHDLGAALIECGSSMARMLGRRRG